jgi:magnesium-transporting ATPase (P-type)
MRKLLLGFVRMGLFSVVHTFDLLLIGMGWLNAPEWQSWIRLTQEQIQTIIFLQILAGGHLLLFVVRSRGRFFSPPWPAKPLFLAVVGTQISWTRPGQLWSFARAAASWRHAALVRPFPYSRDRRQIALWIISRNFG